MADDPCATAATCTGDDSCQVSDHWPDPASSGPHRGTATAAPWCPRCNHRIGGDKPCPHGVRPTTTAAPRIGEYGYKGSGQWGYTCSLCWRPYGPFRTEDTARKYGDLHASECSRA